jgi:hypothetical protein
VSCPSYILRTETRVCVSLRDRNHMFVRERRRQAMHKTRAPYVLSDRNCMQALGSSGMCWGVWEGAMKQRERSEKHVCSQRHLVRSQSHLHLVRSHCVKSAHCVFLAQVKATACAHPLLLTYPHFSSPLLTSPHLSSLLLTPPVCQ